MAITYGSGGALIVDELALLLDLEDVYWAKEGRTSVDAAVAVIAAGATFFAGLPFWPSAGEGAGRARRPVRPAIGQARLQAAEDVA